MSDPGPCPLCERPLYAWIVLPAAIGTASVGMPLDAEPAGERVVDRCESCGAAVPRGAAVDVGAEWEALLAAGEAGEVSVPNRASLQAAIGVEGWAAIDRSPGELLLTPRSLELLAERNGRRLDRVRTPVSRRAQAWMWQTLLNGLTFTPNFAREVRGGALRPGRGGDRLRFVADSIVTVLGAPLIALVSVPLELIAALLRRGGELRAVAGER